MFVEELTKIREAETKAEELQKKAKAEAKKLIEKARSQSEKILEAAQTHAKETYDEMIRQGQEVSEKQYREFLQAKKLDCEEVATKFEAKQSKAVTLITERIVSVSVDH